MLILMSQHSRLDIQKSFRVHQCQTWQLFLSKGSHEHLCKLNIIRASGKDMRAFRWMRSVCTSRISTLISWSCLVTQPGYFGSTIKIDFFSWLKLWTYFLRNIMVWSRWLKMKEHTHWGSDMMESLAVCRLSFFKNGRGWGLIFWPIYSEKSSSLYWKDYFCWL